MPRREIWRAVPGLEEYFEVSIHGRIRRLESVRNGIVVPERIFYRGGRMTANPLTGKAVKLAYLVLFTFKGPSPTPYGNGKGKSVVRHLNDDDKDHRPSNLAWGTQKDNVQDAIRNGVFKPGTYIMGTKHTLKQRKARSVAKKEWWQNPENIKKMSIALTGRHWITKRKQAEV